MIWDSEKQTVGAPAWLQHNESETMADERRVRDQMSGEKCNDKHKHPGGKQEVNKRATQLALALR